MKFIGFKDKSSNHLGHKSVWIDLNMAVMWRCHMLRPLMHHFHWMHQTKTSFGTICSIRTDGFLRKWYANWDEIQKQPYQEKILPCSNVPSHQWAHQWNRFLQNIIKYGSELLLHCRPSLRKIQYPDLLVQHKASERSLYFIVDFCHHYIKLFNVVSCFLMIIHHQPISLLYS